jgi:hypothetical protein
MDVPSAAAAAHSLDLVEHRPSKIHDALNQILLDRLSAASSGKKKRYLDEDDERSPSKSKFEYDWYGSVDSLPAYSSSYAYSKRKPGELDAASFTDEDDATLRDSSEERSESEWSEETVRA